MFPRLRPPRPPRLIVLAAMALAFSASSIDAARASLFDREVLSASGVRDDVVEHYSTRLEELVQRVRAADNPALDVRTRARAIHAFLHRHVLSGRYEASASDLGAALDGGPFNCAATSVLFATLAAGCGLDVQILSVPGHVWSRVTNSSLKPYASSHEPDAIEIETTNPDWFLVVDRWNGVPTERVSASMAAHRRRVPLGRVLSREQLLAVFHFNRGVTFLRRSQFAAAALANFRALTLDPACRPALENLVFAIARTFRSSPALRTQASAG